MKTDKLEFPYDWKCKKCKKISLGQLINASLLKLWGNNNREYKIIFDEIEIMCGCGQLNILESPLLNNLVKDDEDKCHLLEMAGAIDFNSMDNYDYEFSSNDIGVIRRKLEKTDQNLCVLYDKIRELKKNQTINNTKELLDQREINTLNGLAGELGISLNGLLSNVVEIIKVETRVLMWELLKKVFNIDISIGNFDNLDNIEISYQKIVTDHYKKIKEKYKNEEISQMIDTEMERYLSLIKILK